MYHIKTKDPSLSKSFNNIKEAMEWYQELFMGYNIVAEFIYEEL